MLIRFGHFEILTGLENPSVRKKQLSRHIFRFKHSVKKNTDRIDNQIKIDNKIRAYVCSKIFVEDSFIKQPLLAQQVKHNISILLNENNFHFKFDIFCHNFKVKLF